MELETFDKVFKLISDELTNSNADSSIEEALQWFREVLNHNVPHGKKNRGVSVVETYKILLKKPHMPEEDVQQAMILGWMVELLQAFFLVDDDIMDQSHTRRGQPCWFRKEGVGLVAINDAIYLESAIYVLLKKHFSGLACYTKLMELFHEVTLQTVTGQCLDMLSAKPDVPLDFSKYTMDRYSAIVRYKTAYYSFCLPVALAMYLAGIYDDNSHNRAKAILLEMGHFFQVQDDYLDCYADPETLGKIGTDIQDRKCSWLIVQALQRCTSAQRKILEENYGVDKPECIAAVKKVYVELDLHRVFQNYEEECAVKVQEMIRLTSGDLPSEIFTSFFKKIFKRSK